jgi:hypothetical protein
MNQPGFTAAQSLYTSTTSYIAPWNVWYPPYDSDAKFCGPAAVERCKAQAAADYQSCISFFADANPLVRSRDRDACSSFLDAYLEGCRDPGCPSPLVCKDDISVHGAGGRCCDSKRANCGGVCIDCNIPGASIDTQSCACGCVTGLQLCEGDSPGGVSGGGMYCTNLDTDLNNCGSCGNKCLENEYCQEGDCECALELCDDGTCPANGTSCCPVPPGGYCPMDLPQCCGDGNCAPDGATCWSNCPNGYCTSDVPTCCNGTCTDTDTDPNNCGNCGVVCLQGVQSCVNGGCVCNDDTLTLCNGICVDTFVSDTNCGDCGYVCLGGQTCQNGECGCPGELEMCSGECVNLSSNAANCGYCGSPCQPGQSCCNSTCVGTASDSNNCGGCGNACKTGQCCSSSCSDTLTDLNNCGACGNACIGSQICFNGQSCVPYAPSCSGGKCVCPTNLLPCGINWCMPAGCQCCGGPTPDGSAPIYACQPPSVCCNTGSGCC